MAVLTTVELEYVVRGYCPCCNGPRYRWAQWTRLKVVRDRCHGTTPRTTRAKVTSSLFRTRPPKIIYPASGACFGEEKNILGPWGRVYWRGALINPWRACARVTVLVLSVCLSVCLCVCVCVCVFSLFWHLAQSGVQTAVSATSARYGHEI